MAIVSLNIENISHRWMEGRGPEAEIVISSRVRLARNFQGYPFPYLATDQQAVEIMELVSGILPVGEGEFTLFKVADLDSLDRQVLVEKRLISPLLVKEARSSAVLLREEEGISIMVNEEDHLRIQCLFSGLQLDKAWDTANKYDNLLEKHTNYAFHEDWGYLTSCPTNVGTGLRASVMVHLPALVLSKQINRILSAISQVGLAVRGFYGEGTEVAGNLVQISNQITLGQSEGEILQNLYGVTRQIIEQEQKARQKLLNEKRDQLGDRAGRALGILTHARLMSSEEAMGLLSDLRLGTDLRLIENPPGYQALNELLVLTRPASLQKATGKKLSSGDRDAVRARLLRERLKMKKEE